MQVLNVAKLCKGMYRRESAHKPQGIKDVGKGLAPGRTDLGLARGATMAQMGVELV